MLRLAVCTFIPKFQPLSKLTYKHGLFRLSQLHPFRPSTRVYSEAGDHSEANLEVRMTGLETDVKDLKTEMKDFRTEIFHKIDILGIKFESGQKEIIHGQEKMTHAFESSQEK